MWNLSSPLQFGHRFFCVTLIINSYCFIDILPSESVCIMKPSVATPPFHSLSTFTIPFSLHTIARLPYFANTLFWLVTLFCLLSTNVTPVFLAKYSLLGVLKMQVSSENVIILWIFHVARECGILRIRKRVIYVSNGKCGFQWVVGSIKCSLGLQLLGTTHHTFPSNIYTHFNFL